LVEQPKSFPNASIDYAEADACERSTALVRSPTIIIDISCKLFSRKVTVCHLVFKNKNLITRLFTYGLHCIIWFCIH